MMSSLVEVRENSLTMQELIHYYREAYEKLYQQPASCYQINDYQFDVNGNARNTHWLKLEIELLHQKLITNALTGDSAEYIAIRKMVRRFQHAITT